MAETVVSLTAVDAHRLAAYVKEPAGKARAGIVVIQEIFGVNRHIRSVADDFASQGYLAIAPALFDRAERGVELGYTPEDRKRGFAIATGIGLDAALRDTAAAVAYAAERVGAAHVGVAGYCWGGTLAWLAATRLDIGAAAGYYGGKIAQYAGERPRCPVMLHFGALDPHIPAPEIDKIRAAHPGIPIFLYDAGHGFNCSDRKEYDSAAAAQARQRTLDFFRENLKG